ncbi:hypothetical protein R1sor_010425 [Riccia sorocarpa]|uniref:LysM domain-containing protein n=1 Tax=Riccia sorocarpa TaxID=122646 RepID=A0ABD3I444_9MARC
MVSSAPNSPGGMARPRQEAGANLLQELEALSQALYKASQAPNLGAAGAQQQPPVAHHQRRDSLPGRHSSDTYPKHLLSPGATPPSNPVSGRKVRHSISAKPSLPLYEEHEQEVEWKTSRPVRHSIAAPRGFDAEEASVPRVERKLQPWHSQGFEQNLPEVTNFPAWLEDNINFSKKLEVAPEKKSIWNWKPFRTLSHIGHTRHNCLFTVHVHAIEGLPSAMNGLRLTVHWRHKDRIAQTMPSRVFQGSAEFEETLQLKCSVYGHKSAHHAIKYMPKAFSLCVVALDVDELNLGEHHLDLSRLLPEAPDSEHEDEDKPLSWTTSFKLSGKAKGGTLVVTFGYEILLKDKHDRSGRFGSVLGSPSPSMPSPSLRSFNGFPHSAHGTPRPRTSDANQYLSPTLSEPGDYHDYMAMEHLNLDESSHHEPPRSSVSNLADQRYKLFGRPEFTGKTPKGLYPSEQKTRSFSFAGGELAIAPTTPKQKPELAEPVKVPSADTSAGIPSYGSSDDEDEQEFIVVDQGVEVGHLPDSIIHHHSTSSQSRFGREASDSQSTTPEHIGTPERSPSEKSVTREHMQVSSPPVSLHESRSVSSGSCGSSGELRRGNSEVVITPPVHVPTVVQHFESVISQQPQLESVDDSAIVGPDSSQSRYKGVLSDFEGEEKLQKDQPETEDYGNARFEAAAEQHPGSTYESPPVSGMETKQPEEIVTVISEVASRQRSSVQDRDYFEDKLASESFGGEDVEHIAVKVGSPREERAGDRMRQPSEKDRLGGTERWEPEHRHSLTSATHEEIRESTSIEKKHEIEMWRNVNVSEEGYDRPVPGSLSRFNPQPPPPPIDDLDDEVDLIAGEFLHMLEEEGDRGLGGAPLGLSSDSENDSPRALLLKQFEQEALLEGGIGLRMGVPEIPELSLDGIEDSRQYESGVQSDEYSLGGWQSEEDFELTSIMEAAESELQKATQTMRSKTRAKMLEDAETEALMQEWGLNEQAFQSSPPKPAQGFLDIMNSQMSSRIPLEPPPLAQGIGSVLQTKDGGMLRSVNPVLLGQGGTASGRLMMQVSKPVVVPSEMGSTGLDIFRRMASGGLDAMALQAMMAMPLEDITGRSIHQIAYESTQASVEGSGHGQNYLTSSGYNSQISSYEGFESGRHSRRPRSGGLSSSNRRGSGGFSDTSDEFVNLEELAPMAMQKIEALAMDGLKIQADMTDETAPYSVDALPYDMGVAESSGRFQKGGLGSLEGVAAMHILGAREFGEDASTSATDGLMSKVISIDEWMRLDAGMIDENDTKDETLAILAAHGAVNKDLVTRGSREDRIRYLQGAKASANFGKGGFMGNMLTIAVLVQLRDPLRNNEPVGAPMMALVQAERVIVPPRPKIPRRQPSLLGNGERRWDDEEEEAEIESPKQPQFKITAVHMSGLKPSEESHSKVHDNKKKAWGTQKQQQSGSRWLLANGMGKSSAGAKHPALKSKPQPSKTTVKPGESLWSISARVHGTGSKWKEVAALNPHIRNPDVILANQKIRTR